MTFEFVDIVLYVIYLVAAIAAAVIVWSNIRHLSKGGRSQKVVNHVPARLITLCVFSMLVIIAVISLLLSSSTPIRMGGEVYNDVLWLKMTDVFIFTIAAMLCAAFAAVVFSSVRGKK